MEEKKSNGISVSAIFLIIAIIVIIAMGYFIYKFYSDKVDENKRANELQAKVDSLDGTVRDLEGKINSNTNSGNEKIQELDIIDKNENLQNNSYISNFKQSVSEELGEDNEIFIHFSNYDYKSDVGSYGQGYITINNKNEAYIMLSTISDYSQPKKIAENVVYAWYCTQGQSIEDGSYILFLKTDGTVSCMRFKTDTNNWNVVFESEEKQLTDITNISNIITISGNDSNGIGGLGVLFIKEDGTCLPYSRLDDLVK